MCAASISRGDGLLFRRLRYEHHSDQAELIAFVRERAGQALQGPDEEDLNSCGKGITLASRQDITN